MNYQADITIVGGGMAGAALALALAKETQWDIALVEATSGPAPKNNPDAGKVLDSRVVALNDASIAWLESLGVWPGCDQQYCCAYQKMQVWDGEGTGSVEFDAAAEHCDQLGVIVENHYLLTQLWQALQAIGRIQLITGEPVNTVGFSDSLGGKQTITLASGAKIKSSLIVAADGAESLMRKAAGLVVTEKPYGHRALVATVQIENPHQNRALQRFSQSGPLAFLPLPSIAEKHYCAIVWSQLEAQASFLQQLDDAAFMQAVERAIEGRYGRILAVHHRAAIALKERHAQQYYRDGLVLLGDAAHTLHPLAGQGVNLGFADAKALFEELQRAQVRCLPLAEPSILARYQRQRRGHNAMAIQAMAGFKSLFESQNPWLGLARNEGMRVFNKVPWLKQQAIKAARGVL
ncbi:MAG TPA: FAD-dependent monooxygenase [Marinagarivorans sp.]